MTMNVWKLGLIAALCCTVFGFGCRTEKPVPPPVPPITGEMERSAADFAAAWQSDECRGVLLCEADFRFYTGRWDVLLTRIGKLGVNRLYVQIPSFAVWEDFEFRQAFQALVVAASERQVAVEAYLQQFDFMPERYGSVLTRKRAGDKNPLLDIARELVHFQQKLPGDVRLAGVTLRCSVDRFTRQCVKMPANALFFWSDDAYGTAKDNDGLMREWFEHLEGFRKVLDNAMPLTVAVPAFYHERAAAKDLSCGTIQDFLAAADQVIVCGMGSRPSAFAASLAEELRSAGEEDAKRVICGVEMASHISENGDALRRRDWADFVRIITFLKKENASGGFVMMPWSNLELLWER